MELQKNHVIHSRSNSHNFRKCCECQHVIKKMMHNYHKMWIKKRVHNPRCDYLHASFELIISHLYHRLLSTDSNCVQMHVFHHACSPHSFFNLHKKKTNSSNCLRDNYKLFEIITELGIKFMHKKEHIHDTKEKYIHGFTCAEMKQSKTYEYLN